MRHLILAALLVLLVLPVVAHAEHRIGVYIKVDPQNPYRILNVSVAPFNDPGGRTFVTDGGHRWGVATGPFGRTTSARFSHWFIYFPRFSWGRAQGWRFWLYDPSRGYPYDRRAFIWGIDYRPKLSLVNMSYGTRTTMPVIVPARNVTRGVCVWLTLNVTNSSIQVVGMRRIGVARGAWAVIPFSAEARVEGGLGGNETRSEWAAYGLFIYSDGSSFAGRPRLYETVFPLAWSDTAKYVVVDNIVVCGEGPLRIRVHMERWVGRPGSWSRASVHEFGTVVYLGEPRQVGRPQEVLHPAAPLPPEARAVVLGAGAALLVVLLALVLARR